MPNQLRLPQADRTVIDYAPGPAPRYPALERPFRERVAYAAAHVVADPLADTTPISPPRLDWDTTLAYRRYLWSLGFAVAEAMDTAQRGMGLDWAIAQELIRRSLAEARAVGGAIACGAGTDHLLPRAGLTLADLLRADTIASGSRATGSRHRAKSIINIALGGGPSHIDMFDLKPNAPAEVRGEFRPIQTSVPGFEVCVRVPNRES